MADDTIGEIGSVDSTPGSGAAQASFSARETSPDPAGGVAMASEPVKGFNTTDSVGLSRELMDEKKEAAQSKAPGAEEPAAGAAEEKVTPKASDEKYQETGVSARAGYGSELTKFAKEKAEHAGIKGAIKGALKFAGGNLGKLLGRPAGLLYDILGDAKEANKGEARDMAKWYTDKGMEVPQSIQDWAKKEK